VGSVGFCLYIIYIIFLFKTQTVRFTNPGVFDIKNSVMMNLKCNNFQVTNQKIAMLI